MRSALLAALVAGIAGHGSLVIPQTRNAIDRFAPQWMGGYPVRCSPPPLNPHGDRSPHALIHTETSEHSRRALPRCAAHSRLPRHRPLGPAQRDVRHHPAKLPGGLLVLKRHRALRCGAELLLVRIGLHDRLQDVRRQRAPLRRGVPVRPVRQCHAQRRKVPHGQPRCGARLQGGLDEVQPVARARAR